MYTFMRMKAKQIVAEMLDDGAAPASPPPLEQWQRMELNSLRDRFIRERMTGFTHQGAVYPPRSREEAEAAWKKVEPTFIGAVSDPEVVAARKNRRRAAPNSGQDLKATPPRW